MRLLFLSFLLALSTIVTAQEWQTDIDTAKSLMDSSHQKIILVFQGSDWCAPCIKLEREIWDSEEFKAYANDNFVLLKADFPRRRKNRLSKEQQTKNNLLAEQYNLQGFFPLVVVLDKEGNILGTAGYEKITPTEYLNILTSF